MTTKTKIIYALAALILLGEGCNGCNLLGRDQSQIDRDTLLNQQMEAAKKAQEEQVRVSVLWVTGGEGNVRLAFPSNQLIIVPGGRGCNQPFYTTSKDAFTANGI